MTDRDMPAYPRDHQYDGHNGMTLRDYFAGQALAGILAGDMKDAMPRVAKLRGLRSVDEALAVESYAVADALLAAREVKP